MPKYRVTHQASPLFQMGFRSDAASAGSVVPSRRETFLRQIKPVMTTVIPQIISAPFHPKPAVESGTLSAKPMAAAATMATVK